MSGNSGQLSITICEAKLTRDTELFSKMDPFVVMKFKDQTHKTKVKDEAGKRPVWNQNFKIYI